MNNILLSGYLREHEFITDEIIPDLVENMINKYFEPLIRVYSIGNSNNIEPVTKFRLLKETKLPKTPNDIFITHSNSILKSRLNKKYGVLLSVFLCILSSNLFLKCYLYIYMK